MLPTGTRGRTPSRASSTFPHYLRRIVKWQQMDIEYTFWQMLHLCSSPKVVYVDIFFWLVLTIIPGTLFAFLAWVKCFILSELMLVVISIGDVLIACFVYQHTKYHKQTKNQWARDDPAFIVVCILLLAVSTLAYCATYDHSTRHAVFVVFSVTCFHFFLTGVVVATFCWFLTNTYLREENPNSHVVEQRVEWLYAFDVHCNSFFPLFIVLYVIHFFLSPLLVAHGFIPLLLSNVILMVAVSYYHYLNFLGYDVLPFLEKTTFFLYPIGFVIILTPIFILSGFNPSRHVLNIYFGQRYEVEG